MESFRHHGRPRLRVVAHLGRVEDILRRHQQERTQIAVCSVSAGAVTALHQLAGILGRAYAPRSQRAFARWAQSTLLPELMDFSAPELTSQHFWEQMQAVPVEILGTIEQELVREVIRIEQLPVQALAYDTTNFYTHIASTNWKPRLPHRGHNKQRRHDLRQLGLALVVDQATQLPLAHVLYEGARADMPTFAAFLQPIRERLRELAPQPQPLTRVFDAGVSPQGNLEPLDPEQDRYVTAVRPSYHRALLAEAAGHLREVALPSGAVVRYEVSQDERGATQVRVWSDLAEYRRLTTRYFGLRILITDRREWSTAQIIAAYRGLSNVAAAFRNLKDPGMLATRPQFHWTDQKLYVHTFMCVTGYLLVRLLWWRAQREAGFRGSARTLLSELAQIRACRIVDRTGQAGRPRVRRQLEEMPDGLQTLGRVLGALPPLG